MTKKFTSSPFQIACSVIALCLCAIPAAAGQPQPLMTSSGTVLAAYGPASSGFYAGILYLPNMTYRGSYLATCTRLPDTSVNGTTAVMNADCQENIAPFSNGSSGGVINRRDTSLVSYDFCLTDVLNNNGHLNCRVPQGSYQATCKNAEMVSGPNNTRPGANYLYAECADEKGAYHPNYLGAYVTDQGCVYTNTGWGQYVAEGDIKNVNGALQCYGATAAPQDTCLTPGPAGCPVQSGTGTGERGGATPAGGYTCGPEGANLPGCIP